MKFKYKLGERVLFKRVDGGGTPDREELGTVTGITWNYTGPSLVIYHLNGNNGNIGVEDSDILGTVTVKRTLTKAKRRKPDSQADLPISNGRIAPSCPDTGLL